MMRKVYPYLEDSYQKNSNDEVVRRDFLKKIDGFVNQKKYFKVTLLNWDEEPLKEIGGDLTTGSITKDGSSSVRRTCQFSAVVDTGSYDVTDMSSDFAINKKIYLEIGIKNYSHEYPEYPILWFPQGIFIISSFSASTSASSAVNINITLKDKMALLNGECGGTFPASTILDEQDTQNAQGEAYSEKVLVFNIIQEVVNHFGNEPLNNIVIEDVPERIKRIVKWNGDTQLYIYKTVDDRGRVNYIPTTETMEGVSLYRTANQGDDIGYVYDDFIYSNELTANAGESVTSVLDKIKSYLGNYEYFYDEYGVFHFREIRNYLNTTQGKVLTTEMTLNDYLVDSTVPKNVYTFSDNSNLLSVSITPQYSNIKNDYIIQGLKKSTTSDVSYPIRYHLAIDRKPKTGNSYRNVLIYKELTTNTQKAIFPIVVDKLPDHGEFNSVYKLSSDSKKAYVYDDNKWKEVEIVKWYDGSTTANTLVAKDWRTELYMRGLQALKNGTDTGYYFAELQDAWPQVYDLVEGKFFGEKEDPSVQARVLTEGNYFLDFIDSTSAFGDYAVDAIGRRSDVVVNEDINCLFEPDIPNVVYLNIDDRDKIGEEEWEKYKAECIAGGVEYSQMRGDIYNRLATGGYHNGAYAQLCFELVSHTIYQTSVSITALPVYYLEPNSRVTLNDNATMTFGDFNVSNISIPLDASGSMSCSLTQCLSKM